MLRVLGTVLLNTDNKMRRSAHEQPTHILYRFLKIFSKLFRMRRPLI
ncbi:hypothetical protein HMP0721_2056 [Pseudoramibacter alactolyticus ATCC 23263]|uniref:Uncharacterized protein n=1 Tax=Pseudoramibacter alactolyticus ATCC 23263 TaxID=887929 RepID=E6MJ71_9FIRM|nr:hypothetical protein HMP0721_2056 [Pseudoramibacter alactolyticus ATCC 23263]